MLTRSNLTNALAIAVLLTGAVLAHDLFGGGTNFSSIILCVGAASIIALNWRTHAGGRNASFLFLVLGYIFLCGRALPVIFGGESQLGTIGFADAFDVDRQVVMTYVELTLSSFLCVHIGSLLPRSTIREATASNPATKIYLAIFVALLPLYIYKNIFYFNYIMSHGGYLAIYQGADHLDEVGSIVRIGALLCLAAFILYFFHETDRKRAKIAVIVFLIVFSSELIIGLRGKFFVISLVLFLFYKLRFGGTFSIRGMVILCISVIALALIVEMTREQKEESTVGTSILLGFLSQQGVTAGVSEYILQYPKYFSEHAWGYLLHQFAVPFYAQSEVPPGYFLGNDVSMSVMPEAYALGFGTGSSYIAELLLLGGWLGVCGGSLVIGWILSAANRCAHGVRGALIFWLVSGIVYYPRTMLHEPIHNLMRYAAPTFALFFCSWLYQRWSLLNANAK